VLYGVRVVARNLLYINGTGNRDEVHKQEIYIQNDGMEDAFGEANGAADIGEFLLFLGLGSGYVDVKVPRGFGLVDLHYEALDKFFDFTDFAQAVQGRGN
jgi:hypothetical protein